MFKFADIFEAIEIPENLAPVKDNENPLAFIDDFRIQTDEILLKSKKILSPKDDDENKLAREYGKSLVTIKTAADKSRKEYNAPYQEKIDANRKSPYYQPSGVGAAPYASAGDFSDSGQKSAYAKMQELKSRLRI